MDVTANATLRHIRKLQETYKNYADLPFIVVPETNTRHAASGISTNLEAANLEYGNLTDRIQNLHILRCVEKDGVTPSELPGITTTNANKTAAVARMDMRLRKGKNAIAISPFFITTTPSQTDPNQTQSVIGVLERMRREFLAFHTIPPSLERHTKVVTYSGKIVGMTDDCLMATLLIDLGNAEYERQALLRNLVNGGAGGR